MSERLDSDVVRLENQGDAVCPYRLKSVWRYADGDLKVRLQYEYQWMVEWLFLQEHVHDHSLAAMLQQ